MVSPKLQAIFDKANQRVEEVEAAESKGYINENIPDGNWVGLLVGSEFIERGGVQLWEWTYEIQDDEPEGVKGEKISNAYNLEGTDQQLGYLKRDMAILEIDEVSEETAKDMVERQILCGIGTRVNGKYHNVYLNRVVGMADEADVEISKGDKVIFERKGKKFRGVVRGVNEDADEVTVFNKRLGEVTVDAMDVQPA